MAAKKASLTTKRKSLKKSAKMAKTKRASPKKNHQAKFKVKSSRTRRSATLKPVEQPSMASFGTPIESIQSDLPENPAHQPGHQVIDVKQFGTLMESQQVQHKSNQARSQFTRADRIQRNQSQQRRIPNNTPTKR